MKDFTYEKPSDIKGLYEIKKEKKEEALLLAGGTNLMVYIKDGKYKKGTLVPIMHLKDLKGINRSNGTVELGSCETMDALLNSPVVQEHIPFLSESLYKFANPLVRTMSTLGGNIGDGSPIADTAPALLVLESEVVAGSENGERIIPINDFFHLPGKTTLKPEEVILKINVPIPKTGRGRFVKLGLRKGTSCAVTSAAVWLEAEGKTVKDIRIALGGVAARPILAPKAEAAFKGEELTDRKKIHQLAESVMQDISPISDVRGTAKYRKEVTPKLVVKAVAHCLGMEE